MSCVSGFAPHGQPTNRCMSAAYPTASQCVFDAAVECPDHSFDLLVALVNSAFGTAVSFGSLLWDSVLVAIHLVALSVNVLGLFWLLLFF